MAQNKIALNKFLTQLELIDGESVFFYNKKNSRSLDSISKETVKKLDIIKPDALYIFNNQPYILFFDLTENYRAEREHQIHKQVWSFDQCPLIFILKESDISIYNAFAFNKDQNRLQKIEITEDETLFQFSFWNLQSGNTWKWLQDTYYKSLKLKDEIQKRRVNQKLFENIKLVREELTNTESENSLSEDDCNILILRLIFIRYLIDRDVELNSDFIAGSTIREMRKSFSDLIENEQKLRDFFHLLNDKFNGVLFKGSEVYLSSEQSKALGFVFRGERPAVGSLFYGFDFYFEIFDFSIIPVEVISGIYESLIDEKTRKLHAAVYTPSFLVEYILVNTIDKFLGKKEDQVITECKIFDPSVGSGIFLVQSYRRMVDKEIQYKGSITKERLKEIAKNNLFGIDINAQALKVSCFSIYIAILDYLEPKSIISDDFQDLLPKLLDENLYHENFFKVKENKQLKNFDFILGNPPWKKDKSSEHLNWVNISDTYSKKITGELEIAQSFLLHSKDFMSHKTVSALIVTSTIFYNVSTTTREFKKKFLTQFCGKNFFDLSAVKQSLFEQQESPASIVFYNLADGENYLENIVHHQSIKANLYLKYFKTLVIEKFDQKRILQKHFIENDWMFKVALYGNTLDFRLLKKLETTEFKIKDIIDEITVFKGAGIERGKDSKPYPGLIGLPIIDNNEIEEYYTPVNSSKILSENDINLSRGRKIEIFKGKKILLKEQSKDWNRPVISFCDGDSVFRKGSFSITSEQEIIKTIYSYLLSDIYTYFLFNISCAWGVGTRPAIRFDEEYLVFPFIQPSDETSQELSFLVDSFLEPFRNYEFQLGGPEINKAILNSINSIINSLYEIKSYEKDIIDYALQVSRYQFQESKYDRIVYKVHNNEEYLRKYAQIFIDEFQKIYSDEHICVEVFTLNYFIAMNFVFTDEYDESIISFIPENKYDEKQVFSFLANNISMSEITKDLYIQKDIKGFESNSFYIIKPNEYKSWHSALAWYDVAEFKEEIQAAELDRLNDGEDE